MAKPAVLIIGWDGATPALLKMWGQRGKLPTIARLMDQGWWGKLRSVIQPGSAQAWTSIVTGCNPGKHGLLGFSRWNRANYTWQLNDSRTRAVPALWQLLSEHGLRSAVLFVPMTYPPDSFNGVMIAGLGIPSLASVRTFPNDFRQELLQKWSPSEIREPGPRGMDSSSFLEAQLKSIDAQAEIVKDLLAKNEFDMCMIVFGQSDRIQHFYWGQTQDNTDGNAANPDDNAVFRVYQRLDAALGRILSSIDLEHTTVIVLSDHGAGPYETIFYLNNWLNEQGWLAYGDSGFSTKSLPKNLLKATGRWVRRLGLASVVRNGLALMPHKFSKQLGNSVVKLRAETPSIDWRRTKVYSIDYYGNIYLNLEGREPLGCVRQGEQARELLEEITSALYEVRHPETNALVIERVYTPDELYTGPFMEQAPNLILQAAGYRYHIRSPLSPVYPKVFGPAGHFKDVQLTHSAIHRLDGILVAAGGGITAQDGTHEGASVLDITPTVLTLLGIPVPSYMDGAKLPFVSAPSTVVGAHLPQKPGGYEQSTYAPNEEAEVIEHLRSLGYLD